MKNILTKTLLMTAIALLAMSCGGDDEETPLPLEGTIWNQTSFTAQGCTNSADDESGSSTCTNTDCERVFLYANTIVVTEIDNGTVTSMIGTYTVQGGVISANFDGMGSMTISFTISGSTMTISFTDNGNGCNNTITYVGVAQADPATYLASLLPVDASLEGTEWTETSYTASSCPNTNDNETNMCSLGCNVLTFSGGTFTILEYDEQTGSQTDTMTGSYTIISNTQFSVTFNDGGGDVTILMNYSISGNNLTLSFVEPGNSCDAVQTYTTP